MARSAGAKAPAAKPAAAKSTTPWGAATVVEEAKVAQRVGEKRFASVFQLLENERGERLVRIAYTTGGAVRRGPVTLRPKDVERLRASLAVDSALAEALGWSGGGA
jgi:hypothetical protein